MLQACQYSVEDDELGQPTLTGTIGVPGAIPITPKSLSIAAADPEIWVPCPSELSSYVLPPSVRQL